MRVQKCYYFVLHPDDIDYQRHIDYIHVNPLKHEHVKQVVGWPYSTFHHYVAQGIYMPNGCGDVDISVGGGD